MTTSRVDIEIPNAVAVEITAEALTAELSDGRTISVPVAWYARLVHDTAREQVN